MISILCVTYYKLFGHTTLAISELQQHNCASEVTSLWQVCPEGIMKSKVPSSLRHIWIHMNPEVFTHIIASFLRFEPTG